MKSTINIIEEAVTGSGGRRRGKAENTNALIAQSKEENQDFEFYPTTREILDKLPLFYDENYDTEKRKYEAKSILDIGAGSGKVLDYFMNNLKFSESYAIEKSTTLLNHLSSETKHNIIGTDFLDQSLHDKDFLVTFCNPPYSEFIQWTEKILTETLSHQVFLVIPQRWKDSQEISEALQLRDAETLVLYSADFLSSEDRRARCKVDLVKVTIPQKKRDSYACFLDKNFPKPAEKSLTEDEKQDISFIEELKKRDLIEGLVAEYNRKYKATSQSLQAVLNLDYTLLKELNVDTKALSSNIRKKLLGLKSLYWSQVFDQLEDLSVNFTYKSREKLKEELARRKHIDFTVENIKTILFQIIAMANTYVNDQILNVWENDIVERCNIVAYKSNKSFFADDNCRFRDQLNSGDLSHYKLDKRIVVHYCGGITDSLFSSRDEGGFWNNRVNLNPRALRFLSDLRTIGHILGWKNPNDFIFRESSDTRKDEENGFTPWASGKVFEMTGEYQGERKMFAKIKAYKNQNIHIQFATDFLCKLNVEYGKIKGWLLSSEQAEKELGDKLAGLYFQQSSQISFNLPLLGLSEK